MGYFKYLASIPVVLSVLAASYGAINYTSKLTNQIDASTTTIAVSAFNFIKELPTVIITFLE